MKKIFAPFLALFVATLAVAGTVQDLNTVVDQLLSPFRNEKTQASLVFKNVSTNESHALQLQLQALYEKIGPTNTLRFAIDDINYVYGDGTAPTTTANGSLGLDITQVLPQSEINSMIPEAESMIRSLADSYTKEFGEAITLNVNIQEKNQDENGNWVYLKGGLDFTIDMSKLPAKIAIENVPATSGQANLVLDVKKGLIFSIGIVHNPKYSGFQNDQAGLKEMLDKLLAQDPQTMADIRYYFSVAEEYLGSLVNNPKQ